MRQSQTSEKVPYTEYPTRLLYLPNGTERLERLGSVRAVPKNYIIIEPDVVPDHCYVVKKGRVITYDYTPSGETRVYNLMMERSLFLEANLLTNTPSPVYFKTMMPSELVCIERTSLFPAMCDDPSLMRDVVESISYKFFSSMDQIRQNNAHNTTWKICNLLFIFADRYGAPYDGKTLIREKISQRMISNLLGINRVTAVRVINGLKDLNLIEQVNGFYCIRDAAKLRWHMEYVG
jgi:CRP/FNR family transcriptional regulator